ncbi:esterase-like activity of phytase family protein [Sphingomonas sp. DT-204]|uniref:esterase-like activity of phytase family protein n=1 Tax=Sphingomonas sp. DT-204 TaxID=3396166 RepID=UPI003F1B0E06
MRFLRVILAVLLLCPSWSGEERLPLYRGTPTVKTRPVALGAGDPQRIGALTFLGGLQLLSDDPAFGGFSSMTVDGDRFTLLSDGGLLFGFRMAPPMRPHNPWFGVLPAGPRSGWRKLDRDSESMVRDPASGRIWVGFERFNMIWRYTPGFARPEGAATPPAMRDWPINSGAETMVRLRGGGFLVFSEGQKAPGGGKAVLRFLGDPVSAPRRGFAFAYLPPRHYRPVDAAELPDGRLLVLNRRFSLGTGFVNKLTLVDTRKVKPGQRVVGREIAALESPLIHDNFEGIAITREGGATIVWLVSDDNLSWFQRTLLLKFRLDLPRSDWPKRERPASREGSRPVSPDAEAR